MATPYLGEITMFGGNFAPVNYAFCDGATIAIAQNTALFSILGTTYGGDGRTTFALPDLRGRLPMHPGNGHVLGEMSGSNNVTLTVSQMPAHTHGSGVGASTGAAGTSSPIGAFPATPASGTPYATTGTSKMAAGASGTQAITGGSQPHNNMMPALAVSFIIGTQGVFPSRN